ncbi:TPA: hypothetical protein N0F65_003465 [Lagenidium giganteum]|uniref:Transmembrane protein n=1 Tax=Lagenidium giganteum TaxID=4803 RepID=A0AAV2YMP8_9STRA|nr:TPA: hypothetical protein N0F65_003465 [Lagenidium giganteum]
MAAIEPTTAINNTSASGAVATDELQALLHIAAADDAVPFSAFVRSSGAPGSGATAVDVALLEAFLAATAADGLVPKIAFADDSDRDSHGRCQPLTTHVLPLFERPQLAAPINWWNDFIGPRYSERRGRVQFWGGLLLGLVVSAGLGACVAEMAMDDVLHLTAFTGDNIVIERSFAFLEVKDEVPLHLTYEVRAAEPLTNTSAFRVLVMEDDEFERYVQGRSYQFLPEVSTNRTTHAWLPTSYIDADEDLFIVIQPCYLRQFPSDDFCQDHRLPRALGNDDDEEDNGQKVFKLRTDTSASGRDKRQEQDTPAPPQGFRLEHYRIDPMPVSCVDSGWTGIAHLLVFTPYLVVIVVALRLHQMLRHCEGVRANLRRTYNDEFAVPDHEVDYWQPLPWDRKVPKTRLLGPCCWRKFRRPTEPFYTWWRHENYFTWIYCPYRNEQLSRLERALIIFCSLYVTFYATFMLALFHDGLSQTMKLINSLELFKLIFRQRRKYFRLKAAGGDISRLSFRLAIGAQLATVMLLTVAQIPLMHFWVHRSCLFFRRFVYFGVLAAVFRFSIVGIFEDFAWYVILRKWGHRDLCPYCTERLMHCDCFNDELLVQAVERLGPKWELILMLDGIISSTNAVEPQFAHYTVSQLQERWQILVARAEAFRTKLEKLRACKRHKAMERRQKSQRHGNQTTNDGVVAVDNDVTEDNDDANWNGTLECKVLSINSELQAVNTRNSVDAVSDEQVRERHFSNRQDSSGEIFGSNDLVSTNLVTFSTPGERLELREIEEQRRHQMLDLLNDYDITQSSSQQNEVFSLGLFCYPDYVTAQMATQLKLYSPREWNFGPVDMLPAYEGAI